MDIIFWQQQQSQQGWQQQQQQQRRQQQHQHQQQRQQGQGFSAVVKCNNNNDNLTDTFNNDNQIHIQDTFHYFKDKPNQCRKPPEVLEIIDEDGSIKADVDAAVIS